MKEMMSTASRFKDTLIGYAALVLVGALSMGAELIGQAQRPREYADGQST